ncbi:MAG: hypothetical protein QOK29_4339, partial [Rhodospirillaceae bacterium]|nr:hypothetical protein [Rhodospirillaceae bacterium]
MRRANDRMSTLPPTLSRFEARERELTALLALYRAAKREREGTR